MKFLYKHTDCVLHAILRIMELMKRLTVRHLMLIIRTYRVNNISPVLTVVSTNIHQFMVKTTSLIAELHNNECRIINNTYDE